MKNSKRIFTFLTVVSLSVVYATKLYAVTPPNVSKSLSIDQKFQKIADQAPGFGGMFFDENGDLNVYLTDPKSKATAKAALHSVFGKGLLKSGPSKSKRFKGKPRLAPGDIKVLPAKFSFNELSKWKTQSYDVFNIDGVSSIDLDERTNRLSIGISDKQAKQSVEDILTANGVPLSAVNIVEVEEVFPVHTVRSSFRPTIGGIQINYPGWLCTLGFNAYRAGVRGFVTNSHCTTNQGGVESTVYYQPNSPSYIGWEIADPNYFTSWWPWVCPWGKRCRYSDSAFIRYTSGVSSSLGRIARTTSWAGGLNINHASPEFRIISERSSNVVGNIIDKVGRTTGWTYGHVIATCQDVGVSGTNIVQKCQDRVQSYGGANIVNSGDSGSPVFVWYGSTVALSGILWGGNIPTGTEFLLSPMRNVERELGALVTF